MVLVLSSSHFKIMGDTLLFCQMSTMQQLDLTNTGMYESSQIAVVHSPRVSEKNQPDKRNKFLMSSRSSFAPLVISTLEFPYHGAAAPRAHEPGR